METFALVLNLLVLIGQAYPKIAPSIADFIKSLSNGDVPDISQEEFEHRINAAVAKLKHWD